MLPGTAGSGCLSVVRGRLWRGNETALKPCMGRCGRKCAVPPRSGADEAGRGDGAHKALRSVLWKVCTHSGKCVGDLAATANHPEELLQHIHWMLRFHSEIR